jgi:hypothetical protein
MKSKFFQLALAILFCLSLHSVNAQSLIKVNPIGLAFGSLNAGYEHFVSEKASWTARANFYSRGILGIRYTGFGVGAGYRFYLSEGERPKGLYAGPIANVAFIGANDDVIGNYTLITLGAVIGYQVRLADRWFLDFNVGPTYGIITGDFGDDTDVFGDGVLPAISIAVVGYVLN